MRGWAIPALRCNCRSRHVMSFHGIETAISRTGAMRPREELRTHLGRNELGHPATQPVPLERETRLGCDARRSRDQLIAECSTDKYVNRSASTASHKVTGTSSARNHAPVSRRHDGPSTGRGRVPPFSGALLSQGRVDHQADGSLCLDPDG